MAARSAGCCNARGEMPFSWKLVSGTLTDSAYGIEQSSRNRPKGFSSAADVLLMSAFAAAPVEDHTELRSREQSIVIGSRLTLVAVGAAAAYAVATWGSPHRSLAVALLGIAAAWALAPALIGAERVVRSRRREALFLAWSIGWLWARWRAKPEHLRRSPPRLVIRR